MLGHAVMRPRRLMVLSTLALGTAVLAACGPGVRDKVASAMEGCLAVRNPLFKAGQPEQALALPLPPAIDTLANQTAYSFGFIVYQETADAAETQAELTFALELGSHFEDEEVRKWLNYFSRSPNPAVAAHAKRLLEKQLTLIARMREINR